MATGTLPDPNKPPQPSRAAAPTKKPAKPTPEKFAPKGKKK